MKTLSIIGGNFCVCFMFLLITFTLPAWGGADPVITTSILDNGGDGDINTVYVGRAADFVVAPDQSLHAVYFDSTHKTLKYACNRNGKWQVEVVETLGGSPARIAISLGIDAGGVVHLLYVYDVDASYQRVRYASLIQDQWHFQTIDTISSGWFSYGAKILFTADGTLNLLYSGDKFHHAALTLDGNWSKTDNIASLGVEFWQATVKGNILCVAQGTYWKLVLYFHDSTGWATKTFSPTHRIQQLPGVAFDQQGKLHALGVRPGEGLNHITIDAGWNVVNSSTVDTYTGFSGISLIVDNAGRMHTFYASTDPISGVSAGIEYMWIDPNGSTKWYIVARGSYWARGLARDSLNNLHGLYYDEDHGDLVYVSIQYNQPPPPVTITTSAGSNGSITQTQMVSYGATSQPVVVTPGIGYHIATVLLDGVEQTVSNPKSYSITLTNVTAPHMVSATFAIDTFTITTSAGSNGSITQTQMVSYGATSSAIVVTPNSDYTIATVLVDNVAQIISDPKSYSITFTNVTAAHTVSATFSTTSERTLTLVIGSNNGGGGSVHSLSEGLACTSDTCAANLALGTTITLVPSPNVDSLFTIWTGSCVPINNNCTVTMTSDKTVTANFTYIQPARHNEDSTALFSRIKPAYDAAANRYRIQMRVFQFIEELFLDRNIDITLSGGYDITYSINTGFTSLRGTLTVGSGSVTVDNFIIN